MCSCNGTARMTRAETRPSTIRTWSLSLTRMPPVTLPSLPCAESCLMFCLQHLYQLFATVVESLGHAWSVVVQCVGSHNRQADRGVEVADNRIRQCFGV